MDPRPRRPRRLGTKEKNQSPIPNPLAPVKREMKYAPQKICICCADRFTPPAGWPFAICPACVQTTPEELWETPPLSMDGHRATDGPPPTLEGRLTASP